MKTQILTFSKTGAILKCCLIALCIAFIISAVGKVSPHEFIQNILEWDSI